MTAALLHQVILAWHETTPSQKTTLYTWLKRGQSHNTEIIACMAQLTISTRRAYYHMQACGNNVQQWNYSIVLLATQILVLASVVDVFLDKNEVRVRFAGSLASLFLKIEQKRLFRWIPNIVLHTYQLLKRQNRSIINENRRRTELPCSSVSCLAVRLQSSKSKTRRHMWCATLGARHRLRKKARSEPRD